VIGSFVDSLKPLYDMLADIDDILEKISKWTGFDKFSKWKLRKDIAMMEKQQAEGTLPEKDQHLLQELKVKLADKEFDPSKPFTMPGQQPEDNYVDPFQMMNSMSNMEHPMQMMKSMDQENNFNVTVNGDTKDPRAVGKAVAENLKRPLLSLAGQQPATP